MVSRWADLVYNGVVFDEMVGFGLGVLNAWALHEVNVF